MVWPGFQEELAKIAAAKPAAVPRVPSMEVYEQYKKQRDLNELLDSDRRSAYPKAAAVGAAAGSVLPIALSVIPWMGDRGARTSDVERAVHQVYMAEALRDVYPKLTKDEAQSMAARVSTLVHTLHSEWRDTEAQVAMERLRAFHGNLPYASEPGKQNLVRNNLDYVRNVSGRIQQLVGAGVPEDRARELVAQAPTAHQEADVLIKQVRRESPHLSTTVLPGEYKQILSRGEQIATEKGVKMPSPNRIYMKGLGETATRAAKGALPFAVLGGLVGAYGVRKKREQLAALRARANGDRP